MQHNGCIKASLYILVILNQAVQISRATKTSQNYCPFQINNQNFLNETFYNQCKSSWPEKVSIYYAESIFRLVDLLRKVWPKDTAYGKSAMMWITWQ